MGQVGARQLKRFGRLNLILIDLAGILVVPAGLEFLERVLAQFLFGFARSIVISCHPRSFLRRERAHVYHIWPSRQPLGSSVH